uniref:Uncharacterized protein n=1 Tax=Rhizophora mucronata TaxID=61149 RepID=A0A2P2NHX5_RHIMU
MGANYQIPPLKLEELFLLQRSAYPIKTQHN